MTCSDYQDAYRGVMQATIPDHLRMKPKEAKRDSGKQQSIAAREARQALAPRVMQMHADGKSAGTIGRVLGIHKDTVYRIIREAQA